MAQESTSAKSYIIAGLGWVCTVLVTIMITIGAFLWTNDYVTRDEMDEKVAIVEKRLEDYHMDQSKNMDKILDTNRELATAINELKVNVAVLTETINFFKTHPAAQDPSQVHAGSSK